MSPSTPIILRSSKPGTTSPIDKNQAALKIPGNGHVAFRQAVYTVIECQNDDMARYLLDQYVEIFGPATETCMENWLDKAMIIGHEEIARLLMHMPTHLGMGTFYTAFGDSCQP
jgi:hypothetical protein